MEKNNKNKDEQLLKTGKKNLCYLVTLDMANQLIKH